MLPFVCECTAAGVEGDPIKLEEVGGGKEMNSSIRFFSFELAF